LPAPAAKTKSPTTKNTKATKPKTTGAGVTRRQYQAEIVPFVLLCCLGAAAATRMIWRKYPPADNGWLAGIVMLAFLALVLAAGSTLLGEVWCWYAESYRIGNHHMSDRVGRLWWGRHRPELFVAAFVVFSLMGAEAARGSIPTGPPDSECAR
jgi:hypothetical protein